MFGSKAPRGTQYYCRGCGEKLPLDCHAQFHPACLKADKRRRTQEKRLEEERKLLAELRRLTCPACGAAVFQEPSRGAGEASPKGIHKVHQRRGAA